MTEEDDSEIYTSGATNILKYPELSDKEKMTGLLSTFEEKQMLSAWANDEPPEDDKEHGIQVLSLIHISRQKNSWQKNTTGQSATHLT